MLFRTFLVASSLFATACAVPGNANADVAAGLAAEEELYSFEEFVRDFDKSYSDLEEYETRRTIFETNLHTIRSHNRNANLSKGGHVLGINPFADQEAHELPRGYAKMLSTTRRHSAQTATATARRQLKELPLEIEDVSKLPLSVDWRAKGVTTPIKSQGMCGSCWAFASTAVLESHVALQTGTLFSFSMQELVSCAPNPLHCGGTGGCAGSTAEIAFGWAAEKGMVQEWDFGYQSYHGDAIDCKLVDKPSTKNQSFLKGAAAGGGTTRNTTHYKGAVAAIEGYYKLPTNNYIVLMNVVAKHGPVAVSVACMPWHLYQGGVFYAPLNTTRATDIDHLVVLEGYGTDEVTGEDYWLVRNSWGPLWGEKGYVRLLRVDPDTLDDPDSDCGMDVSPADGAACTKDEDGNDIVPPPAKICGNSGILYDTSIPLGGHLL